MACTLYLSGLNISTLADRLIYVRFKFGQSLESVTLPALVAQASGITPETNMELLVLSMTGRPFENLRLLYDLYDYNQYASTDTPTVDPRNVGLYCRGLNLAYDPTFTGNLSNSSCDASGETCLYSYAKVVDSGLYYTASSTYVGYTPTTAQLDPSTAKLGYATHVATTVNALSKCLPDGIDVANLASVLGANTATLPASLYWDLPISLGGTEYRYRGPYRSISTSSWQVTGDAIFSSTATPTGLFEASLTSALSTTADKAKGGYKSFLFPRTATRSLRAGVEYFGSSGAFDSARSLTSLSSAGDSLFMDGCNARLVDNTAYITDSIGACNVTATIEVFYKDTSGNEVMISSSSELKLQLTRASETDYYGAQVVYSAMNSCTSSNSCGSSQCCYNNRCWSKTYVSQCAEDVTSQGNYGNGVACTSDYQCASLCCNSGICQAHISSAISSNSETLCSKGTGQSCVAQEWCSKVDQTVYKLVKTGTDSSGATTCAWRSYLSKIFQNCTGGVCTAPVAPTAPPTSTTTLDCTNAVDASSLNL